MYSWGKTATAGQLGVPDCTNSETASRIEGNGWIKVSCGGYHCIALNKTGTLYGWGANFYGQLGLGKNVQKQMSPRVINILDPGLRVVKFSCGWSHTVALAEDGSVFTWGGEGQPDHNSTKVKFPNDVVVYKVIAGNCFSLAVSSEGDVYSWGSGMDGRLGVGSTRSFRNPQKLKFPDLNSRIYKIAAGKAHCIALSEAFDMYTWGSSEFGQLGHGDRVSHFTPTLLLETEKFVCVAAGERHSLALTGDGHVYSWGQRGEEIREVPTLEEGLPSEVEFRRIAVGLNHNMALTEYGDMFVWGDNKYGQCGVQSETDFIDTPEYLENIPDQSHVFNAAGGERHTIILTSTTNKFEKKPRDKKLKKSRVQFVVTTPKPIMRPTAAVLHAAPPQDAEDTNEKLLDYDKILADMEDYERQNSQTDEIESYQHGAVPHSEVMISPPNARNLPQHSDQQIESPRVHKKRGCFCTLL